MKNTPFLSNFTAGELSSKYTGRVEDSIYYKGVRTMENMRPMAQGGFKHTGGSLYMADLPPDDYRLIPFVVSEALQYLICLGRSQMIVYSVDQYGLLSAPETIVYGLTYSEKQLYEVQYCQNYNQLYLTHKNHGPKVMTYTGSGFTYGDLAITTNAGETVPFQGADNYPGCCAFFSGRLFLAGTIAKPQGIWASMPFEPGNFTNFESYTETRTELKEASTWADPETPETETVITVKDIIGDAHSFHFEIASDQNDAIVWLAAGTELVIGTITSEWVCPDDITANNITAKMKTRFGSTRIQARMVGDSIILCQRSGKKIREYKEDENSAELTFTADHITGDGIRQFDAAKVPDSLIYFLQSGGDIAVLMYDKPNEIQGWYRLTAPGTSEYKSVACVSSESGDFTFTIVKEGINSWIERLEDDFLTQRTGYILLNGDGNGIAPDYFKSKEVQIWSQTAGNTDNETVTVAADGSVSTSLPYATYYIGTGFTSVLETMSLETEGEMGTSQMKTRAVPEVFLRVLKGGHFKIGYSSHPDEYVTVTETGFVTAAVRGSAEQDASLRIVRDQPFPLMVTMVIPELEVNEV